MQSKSIFRQVALERLSSPEQLDQIVQVTSPKSWLALLAIGTLLVTAVIWSAIGRIPVQVSGSAILLNSGGVKNVVSVATGQITSFNLEQGQLVEAGELIAEILPAGAAEAVPVYSPYNGRILELKADVGSLVGQGASLASLEFAGEGVEQEVVMYIAPADGKRIQPGMTVQIAPITAQVEEHGFLLGQVASVSEFPATYAGMLRVLGSEELIQALGINGAPIEVRIVLQADESTPSGYRWSSSQGPDFSISSGTLASATITLDNPRPITQVLPLR
jgi:hypothetical protein